MYVLSRSQKTLKRAQTVQTQQTPQTTNVKAQGTAVCNVYRYYIS